MYYTGKKEVGEEGRQWERGEECKHRMERESKKITDENLPNLEKNINVHIQDLGKKSIR